MCMMAPTSILSNLSSYIFHILYIYIFIITLFCYVCFSTSVIVTPKKLEVGKIPDFFIAKSNPSCLLVWFREKFCLFHGSLNVPIEHHPTIRYMVYNGYFFRWCPIFPKWDSYQPLCFLLFNQCWWDSSWSAPGHWYEAPAPMFDDVLGD
jgi:hypothetical protein